MQDDSKPNDLRERAVNELAAELDLECDFHSRKWNIPWDGGFAEIPPPVWEALVGERVENLRTKRTRRGGTR